MWGGRYERGCGAVKGADKHFGLRPQASLPAPAPASDAGTQTARRACEPARDSPSCLLERSSVPLSMACASLSARFALPLLDHWLQRPLAEHAGSTRWGGLLWNAAREPAATKCGSKARSSLQPPPPAAAAALHQLRAATNALRARSGRQSALAPTHLDASSPDTLCSRWDLAETSRCSSATSA